MLLYFLSLGYVFHCALHFFLCVLEYPPKFLAPLSSVFCATAATFRLHIYSCRTLIWSYYWLGYIVKFPFVVFSSVNAASCAAVADAKFMKASSISLCLTFFALSYPASPVVCLSSSRSRYASWKCALKCTHVCSFAIIIFHVLKACVYSCATNIW